MLHALSFVSTHIMETPPSTQQKQPNANARALHMPSQHKPVERARLAPDLEWTQHSMSRLSFAEVTYCSLCGVCITIAP